MLTACVHKTYRISSNMSTPRLYFIFRPTISKKISLLVNIGTLCRAKCMVRQVKPEIVVRLCTCLSLEKWECIYAIKHGIQVL